MLSSNGLQQQCPYYEREAVVRRIACNNVRYTLTSRYVEFCQPLGDVREPDTLTLSVRLKKSIPYLFDVAEKYEDTNGKISSEVLLSSRISIDIVCLKNVDLKL